MGTVTTYALEGPVATVTMDDGKANALSPLMLSELHDSVDRARDAGVALVLAGRPGRFSAGFHLPTLTGGGAAAADLLLAGFELAEKLLSHPRPVVVACTGHALAMGSFLLVSGDVRIGAAGDFRIGANEVAIGLTMPRTAIELCRQRLATPYLSRAMVNAEIFDPEGAAAAGYLDRVVPADEVADEASRVATDLAGLDGPALAATKARLREDVLRSLRGAIEADDAEMRALFT